MENISGIDGKSPKEDLLFVTGGYSLFVRGKKGWKEIGVPEEANIINNVSAHKPDEVYIAYDAGILCYNGKTVETMDSPDETINAVVLLSESEMLAVGDDGVFIWTEKHGWKSLKCPSGEYGCWPLRVGDIIYLPTSKGLVLYTKGKFSKATKIPCTTVARVGNAILTFGDPDGGLMAYDLKSKKAREIKVPIIAPGAIIKKS